MNNKPRKGHGFIYKYTSPSGKSYIGQTVQSLSDRAGHNGKNYLGCKYFHNAIKKYGWNNFKVEILGEFPIEQLNYQERKFIEVYNTLAPYGYNIQYGGDRNYHKGRKIVYQYNKNGLLMRSWNGQKEAADTLNINLQSLNQCLKGSNNTAGGYYWSFIPLEFYPILSVKKNNNSIPIEQLDKDTLQVIQTYSSISEASRAMKASGTSLIRRALKNISYSAYGYRWRKTQGSTTNDS